MFCIEGLNSKEFKQLLSVRYCVSNNKSTPMFCGVIFHTRGSRLYAEALDGYRVSIASMECKATGAIKFLVPSSVLVKVDKALKVRSAITIGVDESKEYVRFVVDGVSFDSKIMVVYDNTDWSKLFPHPNDINCKVVVDRKALLEAVKSLRNIDKDSKKPKLCKINILRNGMSLNIDTHPIEMEYVDCKSSGTMQVGVNLNYLYAMVNSIKETEVVLELVSPVKPIVVRGNIKSDLVMPIRIVDNKVV